MSNADLLNREHRLYQTDYLLRKYGFSAEEIGLDAAGNRRWMRIPRKSGRRHPERFPVDVNRADKEELLRVPGRKLVAEADPVRTEGGGRIRRLEDAGVRAALARKAAGWIGVVAGGSRVLRLRRATGGEARDSR